LIGPDGIASKMKAYSTKVDELIITKAFIFALEKHGTQVRDSGKLFFTHPLEVSEILVDLKMDQETVIAGLLHDVVEDTDVTVEDIEAAFGRDISKIVDGVTKINRFEAESVAEKQAEDFKKLLLSASSDIRILIIKLADRLHNMRTLKFRKAAKRKITAKETLAVYAPLADRVGLTSIKEELQDIAFKELEPGIYNSITSRLDDTYRSSNSLINKIILVMEEMARKLKIPYCSVSGRVKTPYSIWKKMNVRNISFDQLSDIMAFRIIVDDVSQCYQILGDIHSKYCVIPGRLRDYISAPKHNNYQSLHTCVIGPNDKRIEIQIRTKEMHVVAELGVAAHWNYKDGGKKMVAPKRQQWLRTLASFVDDASEVEHLLSDSYAESLSNMVFCVSPKKKIIALPAGATALDFAYAIHTYVGNHAVDATINHIPFPVTKVLNNGDQVAITVNPKHVPEPNWTEHIVTAKAKASIRKFLNRLENEKSEMIGRSNFEEFVKNHGLQISNEDIKSILKNLKLTNEASMFRAIGNSSIHIQDIFPEVKSVKSNESKDLAANKRDEEHMVRGLSGFTIVRTECCVPIPGDGIVGVMLPDNKVEVHLSDCRAVRAIETQPRCQILDLLWSDSAFNSPEYITKISVKVIYESGNLSSVSNAIKKRQASIVSLRMTKRCENTVNLLIELTVSDAAQLYLVISDLMRLDFVKSVSRNMP
jgi:GTP pyrophosphokinase